MRTVIFIIYLLVFVPLLTTTVNAESVEGAPDGTATDKPNQTTTDSKSVTAEKPKNSALPEDDAQADTQADAMADAKAHFKKGQRLFEAGEYKDAAIAFTTAYKLSPHPAVKANIGLCYESIGDLARAYELYIECIAVPDYTPPTWLTRSVSRIEPKIVQLTIECLIEDCEIEVNSKALAQNPAMVYLPPGEHVAAALADGRHVAKVTRQFSAGEKADIVLVLPPEQINEKATPSASAVKEPLPSPQTAPRANFRQLSIPLWVTAGVTVASAATMTILGIKTMQIKDDYDNSLDSNPSLQKRGERYRNATNAMLAITLASLATTVVFGYLDLRKATQKDEAVSLRVGPGAVAIKGSF